MASPFVGAPTRNKVGDQPTATIDQRASPAYDDDMRRLLSGSVLFLSLALGACDNTPTYMKGSRSLETTTDDQGESMGDQELFVLPIRRPTAAEMQKLAEQQAALGLEQPLPWVTRDDLGLELRFSVKNLEDRTVTAFVKLDGGSEFGDYQPSLYVDLSVPPQDRITPPSLSGGTPIVLGPNQSTDGIFREDQIYEAAIDLEAIVRYPDMEAILNVPFVVIQRRSYVDKTGLELIPAKEKIPAFSRLLLQLSADGHVALDYVVRARPTSDRDLLRAPTDMDLYIPTDASLAPPVMPPVFMPPMPTP